MTVMKSVKVAGIPVGFDQEKKILQLAGDSMTVGEWEELRHRINTLVTGRAGLRGKERVGIPQISPFVSENLDKINKMTKGRIIDPPFWLKSVYSAVITKDVLDGND